MKPIGLSLGLLLLAVPARADAPPPAALRMFKAKCASCHGADGKAQTDQGRKLGIRDMSTPAWQAAHPDATLQDLLGNNKPVKSNGQETAHFSTKLKPEEVTGLMAVLRSFRQ
jgi:mono/diheme cytochrome c family protein